MQEQPTCEEFCEVSKDHFRVFYCFTWTLLAACKTEVQKPDCIKMKNDAKTCMELLGNVKPQSKEAAMASKEGDASQSSDANEKTTAASAGSVDRP